MTKLIFEMSSPWEQGSGSASSVKESGDPSKLYFRIEKLEERVRKLELQAQKEGARQMENNQRSDDKSSVTFLSSLSTADHCGTCWTRILTTKLACLQFTLMILFFIGFVWYAVVGYYEAHSNEQSDFKPQRLMVSKDYGTVDSGQYDMPYFYLEFWITELEDGCEADILDAMNCTVDREWTDQDMIDAFSGMWKVSPDWVCSDRCEGSVKTDELERISLGCEYSEYEGSLDIPEVSFGVVDPDPFDVFDSTFVGYIRFKPKDPKAGHLWGCFVDFDTYDITKDNDALLVYPYELRIDKHDHPDFTSKGWSNIELDIDNILYSADNNVIEVVYGESILTLYQMNIPLYTASGNNEHIYDVKIEEQYPDSSTKYTSINIVLDMPVNELEEYVEYSYLNWVCSMGGLLSLLSVQYYCICAIMVKVLGQSEWDMGILPVVSPIFLNRESLYWLKAQLKNNGVIELP